MLCYISSDMSNIYLYKYCNTIFIYWHMLIYILLYIYVNKYWNFIGTVWCDIETVSFKLESKILAWAELSFALVKFNLTNLYRVQTWFNCKFSSQAQLIEFHQVWVSLVFIAKQAQIPQAYAILNLAGIQLKLTNNSVRAKVNFSSLLKQS